MKRFFLFSIGLFIALTVQANERYFVTAESGLVVRDAPNAQAKRIGKLHYGATLNVIEESNISYQVKGKNKIIKGQWVKIDSYLSNFDSIEKIDGYIFSGYLEKLDKRVFDPIEVDSLTFNKLYRENKKSIKSMSSLEEVRRLLGSRLKWKVNEYGSTYISEIILNDGSSLIINEDYIEFIAYFPSEEIILFHGGHASEYTVSLKTRESIVTLGNPEHIIESPSGKRRLNGWSNGQECTDYFFQEKIENRYSYITSFDRQERVGRHFCFFTKFSWINDDEFVYSYVSSWEPEPENGDPNKERYFRGSFKE